MITWKEAVSDLDELETDKIVLSNENNVMLCDGNNIAYRYLKRHNFNNFGEDYERTITSLAKSYGAKKVIVVFDFGKSVYRKTLHPEYKANRKQPKNQTEQEHYDQFFDCLNKVANDLPFEVIKHRGVEGDDIIAYLALGLKDKYDNVWIISSDKDLYQLLSPNVKIFNMFSRTEIDEQYVFDNFDGINPLQFQIFRIISGDDGDNIKGIEGIGKKRGPEIAKNYKDFAEFIAAIPLKGKQKYVQNLNVGRDMLLLNEKLINLLDHHKTAIESVENGQELLKRLEEICKG